jgi:hypothetical protein
MSFPCSIALRRLPLTCTSSALPRARLITAHLSHNTSRAFVTTPKTSKMSESHEQRRGEETTGLSEWKTRPPYRVHEKDEHFDAKYEANCHCGKVQFQLSRKEPLDSKLCHCTTCQTQHGVFPARVPISPSPH